MKKDKFYITTPIYYGNGVPHVGHFYSSLITDIIARYKRISGFKTRFTTGIDENSQKSIEKASEQNMEIMDYIDKMAKIHKDTWDKLGMDYTDFIRTTEKRHHSLVREVLQKTWDAGDIYEGEYEGLYCVGCEAFKKDDELIEKDGKRVCHDHLKEPDKIKEKNYFFKLSKYQDKLLKLYEDNPDFVMPRDRFNEVIAFVKRGLEDFSISRETNTFGVKLPFDETQVAYVWFDALYNYVTSCKYSRGGDKNNENFVDESGMWPADLHVVGKDIIRFHAIYWPAMLMSAGYELPKNILTTGFFTIDGHKISKSLGNVIDPVEYSEQYSKDALSLYLLSSFNIGQDGDFDHKQAILTYNAKLANNLGNLLNRVVVLGLRLEKESGKLYGKKDISSISSLIGEFDESFNSYNLKEALDSCFTMTDILNKYADDEKPWNTVKEDTELTREVLYNIAEGLRQVGLCLYPFFPEKMSELFEKLGLKDYDKLLKSGELDNLRDKTEEFKITEKGDNLFDRLEYIEEKEESRTDVKITINPELEKKGIKFKAAVFNIPEISKKRGGALKGYIKEAISKLDKEKINSSEFIKRAEQYYKEAGLSDAIHPAKTLLGFVEKSNNIPNINRVVDAYNIVTLEESLSVGVHDLDKILGNVKFDYTTGLESYIPLTKTEKLTVSKGEYACMDEEKILCRMDYKQCDETKISEKSKTLLVYVQGNSELTEDEVKSGLKKVCETIKTYCGGDYNII